MTEARILSDAPWLKSGPAGRALAQVGIPGACDALLDPLVAQALVTVVGRTTRQQYAVRVVPREHEVEK